jgi:thioesterase domain-containing protein
MRERLQAYLDQHIPITQEIGIKVNLCNERVLILTAPLAANKNDKNTAFGGSLAAMLTLAGWAVTHIVLQKLELKATTVVRRSKLDYIKPVESELMVLSNIPNEQEIYRFKQDLLTRGKARWELSARAECKQELAVDFSGVYVAILEDELRKSVLPSSQAAANP